MEKLVIVGIGTTADLAVEFIKSYQLYEVIGYAVNKEYMTTDKYNGLPVYDLDTLCKDLKNCDFKVFVAILWNQLNRDRKNVYNFCKSKGFRLANLISPTSIVRGAIEGDNIWIHDFVVIQDSAVINSNVMIMAYSLVGSRTIIGAHCFLGARSLVAGNCTVGEQSFIGLSATIFDETHIGNKCIVGACTAVKRNMPDYSKYITSSNDIVIKQYH